MEELRCSEDGCGSDLIVFSPSSGHNHTQRGVDKVSRLVWDRLGLKGLWLINLETTSQ